MVIRITYGSRPPSKIAQATPPRFSFWSPPISERIGGSTTDGGPWVSSDVDSVTAIPPGGRLAGGLGRSLDARLRLRLDELGVGRGQHRRGVHSMTLRRQGFAERRQAQAHVPGGGRRAHQPDPPDLA